MSMASALESVSSEVRVRCCELLLSIASQSLSSGGFVAVEIPDRIVQMQQPAQIPYIDSFEIMIKNVVICAVRFCLAKLQERFCAFPPEEVLDLVDEISVIATRYGSRAAFTCIDRLPKEAQ